MPRKQPRLVPFLQEALDDTKYRNLVYENHMNKVFSLYLPHKTNRLEKEDQFLLFVWYAENKRKYIFADDYSNARQAMTAALRKSIYVELMYFRDNKLVCRILNEEEVEERKQEKKELKMLKKKKEDDDTSAESGYESALNSPESCMDYGQNDKNVLEGVAHDHAYVFSPLDKESAEGRSNHSDVQEVSNETILTEEDTETFGNSMPLKLDDSLQIKSSLDVTCLEEDFSGIPVFPGDVTLKDLEELSSGQLIRSSYNDLQSLLQVYDSNGAETNAREKIYVCSEYVPLDETVLLLICKLFQEMDAEIPDTSSNIRIVLDEAVQRKIQGYSCLKMWMKLDDHNLMVFLELPFISHR